MSNTRSARGHKFEDLSYLVIGACIEVQRQLGLHCMEVDYQRALELALRKRGLECQREVEIPITFDGVIVTRRRVDFVIRDESDELLLETKARSRILAEDVEQCLLYLHRGGYRVILLVNFGQKPIGVKRFIHTPESSQRQAADHRVTDRCVVGGLYASEESLADPREPGEVEVGGQP